MTVLNNVNMMMDAVNSIPIPFNYFGSLLFSEQCFSSPHFVSEANRKPMLPNIIPALQMLFVLQGRHF